MNDDVNFPSHYTSGDIEAIDAIWSTGHGFGYCVGNALKYLFRAGKKTGSPVEDIAKARWYLSFLLSKISDAKDPREVGGVHEWSIEDEKGRVWVYISDGRIEEARSAFPDCRVLRGVLLGERVEMISVPADSATYRYPWSHGWDSACPTGGSLHPL